MNIYGDIKYNLDKEIIEFTFDIVDLKNEKMPSNNDIHFIDGDKIDFVSKFMNEYLKVYNGAFKIKKIDDRLIIKIELIKDAN